MGNLEVIISSLLYIQSKHGTKAFLMGSLPTWLASSPPRTLHSYTHLPLPKHTTLTLLHLSLIILFPLPGKSALFMWVSLLQTLQTSAWKVSWKPFLNTVSRFICNFHVLYAVCSYFLQSNDHNVLSICMVLHLTLEARGTASLQVLRLAQWLQHRRHSIYICQMD